jgi:MFS family permease
MLALLRERNFALLWFGGLISLIGDRAMMTALPFYIYQQTGSTLQTAALFTAYYLPMVLFGSVAGVFVDRWDRRWIMVVANFVQAVVMLALLLVRSDAWLWLVYCVAFVQTTASMFFGPAESAIVPNLVDERDLVPANTLGNLNNSLARLIGPPIGGALLGWFGLGGVVIIDSASFLIAGLMAARISISGRAATPLTHVAVTEHVVSSWLAVWHEWREGLRLVRHDRLLLSLFVVATVTSFGGSLIDPLFVPFAIDHGGGGRIDSRAPCRALGQDDPAAQPHGLRHGDRWSVHARNVQSAVFTYGDGAQLPDVRASSGVRRGPTNHVPARSQR